MDNSDFEGPPLGWSIFSIISGLATAIALIFGLELSAEQLRIHRYYSSTATQSTTAAPASSSPSAL